MTMKLTHAAVTVACIIGTLSLPSMVVPAYAKLSLSTGPIYGELPTLGGRLLLKDGANNVLLPDSPLVLTNTSMLTSVSVSSDGSELTLVDPDGDLNPTATVVTDEGSLVFKDKNGHGVTPTQLMSGWSTSNLTIEATAPVKVATLTGIPNSGVVTTSSPVYQVTVLSNTQSTLSAVPASVIADGVTTSQITFMLKDAEGNRLPGQLVTFASSLVGSSIGPVTDNGDGTYTAKLVGTSLGLSHITVQVKGAALDVPSPAVTLTADANNLDATKSALAADSGKFLAVVTTTPVDYMIGSNTRTSSTVTLTLKDKYGHPVSGQTVKLTSTLGSLGNVTDNGDGTYSAVLSGTTEGTAQITATVGGKGFAVTSASVRLVGASLIPVYTDSTWSLSGTNRVVTIVGTLKYISKDDVATFNTTLQYVGISIYCGPGEVYPAGSTVMNDYSSSSQGGLAATGINAYVSAKYSPVTVGTKKSNSFTWSATQCPNPDRVEFGTAYSSKQAIYRYPNDASYPLTQK